MVRGLALALLSLQPDPAHTLRPDRPLDMEALDLDLLVDVAGGSVAGSATWTATVLQDALGTLRLDGVALQVQAASIDGVSVPAEGGEEGVVLRLDPPLPRGRRMQVRVEYEAHPATGLHFRGPGPSSPDTVPEVWSQGESEENRYWFPSWDHPGDRFRYAATFRADERLTVVSNGELVARAPDPARPGHTVWRYELRTGDLVAYLVALAAAPYQVQETKAGPTSLLTYAAPEKPADAVRRAVAPTGAMLDFFAETTGRPYPHPVYRQIFVQRFLYGGMENTAATIMDGSRFLFRSPMVPHHDDADGIIAHELAHQWYGDLLTCRDWTHLWLNEGFATYMTDLWNRHRLGDEGWARSVRERVAGLVAADRSRALPMVARFYSRQAGHANAHVYTKGASVLQMLRVLLGDEVFFAGLRSYTHRHAWGLVETDDLRRAMEDESGLDLSWFFDQWAYLPGHPELELESNLDPVVGRLQVTARQVQNTASGTPLYRVPLDLEIADGSGVRRERMWIDGARSGQSFPVEGGLRWVATDPAGGLLAEIRREQDQQAWVAQLLGSPSAPARWEALAALRAASFRPTSETRAALSGLLLDPGRAVVLRGGAAQVLGAWGDAESGQCLKDALARVGTAGEELLARRAILSALGELAADPGVIGELRRIAEVDRDEPSRIAALQAVSKLRPDVLVPLALKALSSASTDGMRVQASAAELLGIHGDGKTLRKMAPWRRAATHPAVLHAALWAGVHIAGRAATEQEGEDEREAVARDTELLLDSAFQRTRETAVAVLGELGSERSKPPLRARLSKEGVPSVRDAIRAALERIGARARGPAPGDRALEARLERLEAELDELRKRVDAAGEQH